ncbi:hypothetical protein BraRD5C2_39730 [Bradyrhizobium sp. RD5-C2]|nr:hypothetical protein BraRD5C2_39730 [Bradyrhizobium sp. RD5-C2]
MPVIRQPFKARTTEELVDLLGTVATAILTERCSILGAYSSSNRIGNSSQLCLGTSGLDIAAHPRAARIGSRECGSACLRTHFCDGEPSYDVAGSQAVAEARAIKYDYAVVPGGKIDEAACFKILDHAAVAMKQDQ